MMWRVVLLASLLAGVAGCPVTQNQDTPVSEIHVHPANGGASYWLYVPSYYSDGLAWPLVITLHGTHGWDSSKAQIEEWKALAEEKGFIVAAPRLKSVQGILPVSESLWMSDLAKDEETILATMDELSARYRVDPACVLITGFSAGGYPMFYTALRHPERFSMIVARNCNSDVRILEGVELTDEARRLPVVVFWGKDDLAEIHQQSWQAVQWLGEHDFKKLKWKKYPGGHLRRPDNAYGYFRAVLPARYKR